LEFRLTYQGLLLSETNKGSLQAARATHKQQIRQRFHPQLKRLWEINPYLAGASKPAPVTPNGVKAVEFGRPRPENSIAGLAARFKINDYHFVPLVTRGLHVLCEIDVLFLRTEPPGSIFNRGDIDNRLKTLLDGLTMPVSAAQLGECVSPRQGEEPFFCLLEDDSLVTRASVETDTLLDPDCGPNDVRVIVTVRLWPHTLRPDNIGFG
jgi:hypothetical protein